MLEYYKALESTILVYTRVPDEGSYPNLLAYSAHFAISRDKHHFVALNKNYGVLFATSTVGADNTIHAKGLKKPWLFRTADGKFAVAAIRVNADGGGDEESRGSILLWTSNDLVHFNEIGLVNLHTEAYVSDVACHYDASLKKYRILWHDSKGIGYQNTISDLYDHSSISSPQPSNDLFVASAAKGPDGAINGNAIEIDRRAGDELALNGTPLSNVGIWVPELIFASSASDVAKTEATASYSDGSTAQKQVKWDTDSIDFKSPGIYEINGVVLNETYKFPLAKGYGDPVILPWKGKYYYIATNDNLGDVGFYVREADTPAALFDDGIVEHLILDKDEARDFIQTFWAPEFHLIGGELYILFAVGGKKWSPQCHLMKFKGNGRIIDPTSWEEPIRIQKKDGSYLADDAITLDMTYFKADGVSYYVWSYRENIGTPLDSGSMLYIATVDETKPWKLTSDPVLLSRPLFGWENVNGTINNEGPYPIVTDDFVYITYSGGAADSYTYALGLLSARIGDDLLTPKNWTKSSAPVLSFYSVENVFGPGHNSFFQDPHGNLMIAYHAEETITSKLRCPGIRRVHFDIHGKPTFDLSADRDLNPKLVNVKTLIKVV